MSVLARSVLVADATDLLALTGVLVDVPSVSREEALLASSVESRLRTRASHLHVERLGSNIVARTNAGREQRVLLAGHLDTVPPDGNARAVRDGDVLAGLGSADMKGGLAVMLRLAEELERTARFDCTLVFYEGEEIAEEFNGLRRLFAERPDLVGADLAIALEPTGNWVEAGCQGTIHVRAVMHGARAHSARPWTGENAVRKLAPLLARVAAYDARVVDVDGLEYRESLEVVAVDGGVARNVVPDRASLLVNRRYAPACSVDDAVDEVRHLLDGADEILVEGASPAAPPNLHDPLVAAFIADLGLPVRPKLGWTDVARFTAHGIPALNFGPGDPELAHTAGEQIDGAALTRCHDVLSTFLWG